MIRTVLIAASVAALSGCVTSDDPGEGGFFNGVSGISSGRYEEQIAAQEADVAAAEARNASLAQDQARLSAQIKAAESELAKLRFKILQQKTAVGSTDPATEARVQRVLNSSPSGRTDAEKLAALQKTIADAKALSADLAKLSG